MIRVVHKKPGMVNNPSLVEIPNMLEAKQRLVSPRGELDSRIERLYAPEFEAEGIEVFGNEEYLFDRDCTPNVEIGGQMIQGPIYFTSYNEDGDAISLTDEQFLFVVAKLRTVVQSIF
jgi:hypothetical protein